MILGKPWRGVSLAITAIASIVVFSAPSSAPVAEWHDAAARRHRTLDSLIRAHAYRLSLQGTTLSGPGADFLLREMARAQFVAIGERHDIREIPALVEAIVVALHRQAGFAHLATENGVYATEMALRGGTRRNRDSVFAFTRRYPNSLAFGSDQDLEMLGDAASELGGTEPVWGLDQEFGATHLLDVLRSLGVPAAARTLFDSLAAAARQAEERRFSDGGRQWMALDSRPESLERLRLLYGSDATPRILELLDALRASSKIYTDHRLASGRHLTGFAANDARETLMKEAFLRHYERATLQERSRPKVIFKMGQAHLARGQSPYGPFTFGTFISDIAMANHGTSFHLAVLAHNPRADSTAPSLWQWTALRAFADALPTDAISIVDLRPIRDYLYANQLDVVEPDLSRTIYGYEAIAIVGGAHDASYLRTRSSKP